MQGREVQREDSNKLTVPPPPVKLQRRRRTKQSSKEKSRISDAHKSATSPLIILPIDARQETQVNTELQVGNEEIPRSMRRREMRGKTL